MPLHPVKLPASARQLFWIVGLQKELLAALSDPALVANTVTVAWVQSVWNCQDPEWVRKFCLGGQEGRIQAIAKAPLAARQALYDEFCRQNRTKSLIRAGGNFQALPQLTAFDAALAHQVVEFFKKCYQLLSTNADRNWIGYEFRNNYAISNRAYKDDFCLALPLKVICPYCDGEIGTPELDHYLAKSEFPLLACSPWNLVPICGSCNDVITAKGDRLAISLGPPRSTDDWLHPFFRPASDQVQIRLTGTPQNSIPQLHSRHAVEQPRLNNHVWLIDQLDRQPPFRSLSKRWTNKAAAYFDVLVNNVRRNVNATNSVDALVNRELESHENARGKMSSSMVHAAVCRAVLDRRPGYYDEFADSNALRLS